jgi:hypothetical protein
MRPSSLLLVPFSFAALEADSLSDLRTHLAKLNGREVVRANVEYQFWNRDEEDKQPRVRQGKAHAWAEDGPGGLKIVWTPQLLQQAEVEQRVRAQDPEKEAPTAQAIEGVSALGILKSFNCAEELLRLMATAQLLEERTDVYQGRAAKLLVLKLSPKVSAREKKHLKEMNASARVWVGPDGQPLGVQSQQAMKGSYFFIKFEGGSTEEYRFARVGNRLVAVYHARETTGGGMGIRQQTKSVTTLELN